MNTEYVKQFEENLIQTKHQQRNIWVELHYRSNGFKRHYKLLPPTVAGHTFFSSARGTSSKIDHIIGYKANL